MNRLTNVSQLIDNSTNPPTIINSNTTFTAIIPPTQTKNYYRRGRNMCNCCMQYPCCLPVMPRCNCGGGCMGNIQPRFFQNSGYPYGGSYGRNCCCALINCLRRALCGNRNCCCRNFEPYGASFYSGHVNFYGRGCGNSCGNGCGY